MPNDFKGKIYRQNQIGHYILAWKEQPTHFILRNLEKNVPSAYMENMLNGEKNYLKLSINRNNMKTFLDPLLLP